MNIPNILTLLRFAIIPVFGYCLYKEDFVFAVFLFTLGGITDILDGYIARKYNLITSFGKLADPLADKLMQITALAFLTMHGLIPAVFLVVVVAKEVFMAIGSITLYRKGNVVVSASWYGKLATVVFYFVIVLILLFKRYDVPNASVYTDVATAIAVIFTLFAFLMYSMQYRRIRKDT